MRGTLVPRLVAERPGKVPIAVEWPDIFYKEPENAFSFQAANHTFYPYESDLHLVDPSENGALAFAVSADVVSTGFRLVLRDRDGVPDYSIQSVDGTNTTIKYRSRTMPLREFFEDEPPTFWFADGSSLSGIEYVELRKRPEPFPRRPD